MYNDTSSMISLWNYAQSDQNFMLTLLYAGGSYKIPIFLASGAAKVIDVGKLIHQQSPDALGNTIPASVTQGSAILAGPRSEADLIEVASSTSVFNVRTATCGVTCQSCNGVANAYLYEAPFPLVEHLAGMLDENRLAIVAKQHGIKKAKDNDSVAKLFAAYLRRAEESALGRITVELTIVLAASRSNPPQVLKDAAAIYKVDTDAIASKVKQEFAAKQKAKKATAVATPKPPAKATIKPRQAAA